MKKLSFFLMAMLVSLTSFAAALGDGYEKVTDISTLVAGDKVVLYCDDASLGVTGVNGTKDAAVAATGWVEYLVEAATGGVKLKDTSANKYVSLTAKNSFTYAASGSVCKVNAQGVLYITLSGSDYFLYQNGTYYRMYVDKTGNSGYKPFYVYKILAEGEIKAPVINAEVEFETSTTVSIEVSEGLKAYYTLDGTEPTTASTEYTAPFEVTETTTVTAVAYDAAADKLSEVTVATLTKLQVLTCAEAAALCTSTASADKYIIKGYVTSIVAAYDASYNNVSFWMADTENGGNVIQAFRVYPTTETDKAVKVGDYVVVGGKLKLYNSTPEIENGTFTITEAPAPEPVMFTVTVTAENGTVEGDGEYEEGKEATLTATAAEGYEFVNWTVDGAEVSTENPYTFVVTANVALVANFKAVVVEEPLPEGVPTNAELWEAFKPYYNTYYSLTRDLSHPVANVSTFANAKMQEIMTDAASEYKWLGDYVLGVAAAQGVNLPTDMAAANESAWRWAVHAFFNAAAGQHGAAGTDFTEAGKPQAWGPYYLAAQTPVEPEPTTETVYFVNAANWTTVNVYAWTTDPNASWPGVAATKEAEQIAGYDVYSYTVEAGTYANVIFNNGSGQQTADLVWTAGKYYVKDGWYTKEEAEAKLAKPVEYEYVYFVNAQGWANVNIYTWTPEVGTWPGVAMTKEAEQLAGYDVYSYKAEKGTSFGGVIFNNGSGTQTGDLKWTAGKYYAKDGWYTKEEAEAKLAAPVVVTWTMVGQEELFTPAWTPTAVENDMEKQEDGSYVLVLENKTLEAGEYEYKAVKNHDWAVSIPQEGNYVLSVETTGEYNIVFTVNAEATELIAEATYIEPDYALEETVEISNLTTETLTVGEATYLQLTGRNDMLDSDVQLFLNNYTGEDKEYEVNAENYLMTFGGIELTVVEGAIAQATDPEKGKVYTGRVIASAEEEGEVMLVALDLVMYATPAIELVIEDAQAIVDETTGTLLFTATWTDTTTMVAYPVMLTVAGFEDVEFKEYEGAQISELQIGDDDNWFDFAVANAVAVFKDGNAVALEGEYTSWATGATYYVAIEGTLPEDEEPVVKPEPTYTENQLNTFAFGLESELNDTALVVTYRLNNSNATSVDVVVLRGEKVVATVPGTTTIGKNTVTIPTAILPQGFQLTWKVVVKGNSVEAPTQEAKIYSFYHPSGLDIDNNPENPTFGMLLINEGMHSVKDKTEGYVSAQFGAGIFAFTPSLDLIPNGELPGYNGGIEFTTGRADGAGTAYSPRRIRISEDGRIFVTSLNTDGNYLWEVNPANMNEWTPVFQGTLNENKELITADSAFIAAPNNGFDVKGAGENLQLAMYSVNLPGITGAAMSGFRLHEYNLGTATEWTTAPSKTWVEGLYAINYTGTQVEYDNEGGLWIASYRGTANDANPGLVHINADGVEDAKLIWSNVRQAGIRFNNDFTKLVVAGNNGAAKKATVYTISKDANGAPVLTEETVIDMASVGNNLNDFAFDYAGNLYACGNSAEKLIGWAMPYSGVVETPAASKYAFHLGNLLEKTEMTGVVKRALNVGESTVVLTHEADGTANLYNVIDGEAYKVSQEGVIARDPENAGDFLAISDIAVTEDGKLVATNKIVCQASDNEVDAGYKRGELRAYIWNDLAADPSILFTSKMSSNWYRSVQGNTIAYKGTSTNGTLFTTGVTATGVKFRYSVYNVIDGVYTDPAVNDSEHYHFTKGSAQTTDVLGANYQLVASPLAATNWILDGELVEPFEIVDPLTFNTEVTANPALAIDLGKKYNGTSIVTVGEQVLMVAPYATEFGVLAGAKVLDITAGLDAAEEVTVAYLDSDIEATAAATAVAVAENVLTITLVADATIYTLNVELESKPDYMLIEEEVTDLMIDTEYLTLAGTGNYYGFEVYLTLGQDNMDGTFALDPENSFVTFGGVDANFIEGYAYDIDLYAPAATAVTRIELDGQYYEVTFHMSNKPVEAIDIVIEDATVAIDTIPMFGDVVEYALRMTANWTNPADGVTYPVLVEVPVYYPEATEPSEIMSTVTVGGWADTDPWLGFGEGYLTVTTVDGVVTVAGLVENTWAGFAANITISGKLPQGPGTGLDNININAKPVKMIKNGMLIINKGGREFNAQGAIVK